MATTPTTTTTALARRMRVDIDTAIFPASQYQELVGKAEVQLIEELRAEDDESYEDDGAAREVVTGYNWRLEIKLIFRLNASATAVNAVHRFLRTKFEAAKVNTAAGELGVRWYDKSGIDDGNSKEGRVYVKSFPPDGGGPGDRDIVSLVLQGQGPLTAITNPASVSGPAVSGVNPAAGGTAAGGLVSIYGAKFTGATAVSFGGTAATNLVVVNDSHIVATKPALTAGTKDVTVTTPAGTSATPGGTENDFVVS